MAKKKCKGGVCSLIGRPKAHVPGPIAQARTAGMQGLTQQLQQTPRFNAGPTAAMQALPQQNVPVPGLTPNIQYTPQAAAQVLANQQAQQQPNPLSALPSSQDPNQTIQALQQQIQQLQQQLQGRNQGPLAGLVNPQYQPFSYFGGPSTGMQAGGFNNSIPIPQMNNQNTALPQGQVFHESGKQRGAVGKFFLGSRPQSFSIPNYTPYQEDVLNYLLQSGVQGLSQNQFDFNPIANQQLEQFYTQTVPTLAERFTAMGDGQRSSAFQGALANAGRFLGNDLAAQRAQFGLQQQGLLQNRIGLGLSPQFSTAVNPGKGGIIPGLINTGVQVAKALI